MVVASGIIPYQYEGIYPFRIPHGDFIGFSGILFEQAMTVYTAEYHRFNGSSPTSYTFSKYFIPGIASQDFTPRPDGYNLDGRIDGVPAGAFFIEYITDLRNALFINYFASSSDLGGGYSAYITDWLLWTGSISGQEGNFTRSQYSPIGIITSSDFNDLGASGVIADIDLREVSWQPYSRISNGASTSIRSCSFSLGPIFPDFISTNGSFVKINSRETGFTVTSAGITRTLSSLAAGLIVIDGDMFFSNTDFCIAPGTTKRTTLEGDITHNALSISSLPGRVFIGNNDNTVDTKATVLVSSPSLSEGGYTIGAINSLSAHPYLLIPSGTLSFHPSIPYNGGDAGSGLYVFNESIWIQDDEIPFSSGLRLLNPLNGGLQWFRFAEQTEEVDPAGVHTSWSRQTISNIFDGGTNYEKWGVYRDAVDSSLHQLSVFNYAKNTLDLNSIDHISQTWPAFGATTTPLDDITSVWYNGSSYYVVGAGPGPARNIWLFDSSKNNTDSKYYAAGLNWVAVGIWGGGSYGGLGSTVVELNIDPDPGNDTVTDTGVIYTIDTTAIGWPGGAADIITKIGIPLNVTTGTKITNGVWCVVETTEVYLVRLTMSGSSLVPEEGFYLSALPTSTSTNVGYGTVYGGFT